MLCDQHIPKEIERKILQDSSKTNYNLLNRMLVNQEAAYAQNEGSGQREMKICGKIKKDRIRHERLHGIREGCLKWRLAVGVLCHWRITAYQQH